LIPFGGHELDERLDESEGVTLIAGFGGAWDEIPDELRLFLLGDYSADDDTDGIC
jgi:hypothetical protein